ncbi:hypothetical protein WDC_1471 [Paucilactobacillus wasatchensis]|uniref:Uncharacterized protein n=1 Tax=Paucilactobacillus wasatchensis TaxID=1335616 RepID=A0A0D1A5E7_9LACO|nr:hypothetical protein WDC_1471 [Paucilactobacillus wasatchensis]
MSGLDIFDFKIIFSSEISHRIKGNLITSESLFIAETCFQPQKPEV